MTAHTKAAPASQDLCDQLVAKLGIEGLNRHCAAKMCSVGVATRFAYVYHRRAGLRVYLYGIEEVSGPKLVELSRGRIEVVKRRAMNSDWAKITPYFLNIENQADLAAAVPLIQFAASQVKPGRSRRERSSLEPRAEKAARDMMEGGRFTVPLSRIERDPLARRECLEMFGTECIVCGFDFPRVYGDIGRGFIHVHHLYPLADAKGRRTVDPKTDLRPVCPNCHAMLHRQDPPLTIQELQAHIQDSPM